MNEFALPLSRRLSHAARWQLRRTITTVTIGSAIILLALAVYWAGIGACAASG